MSLTYAFSGSVVLIEDDPGYRWRLTDLLEGNGLEVIGLETANHALRYFELQNWAWRPSLIITDLVMEGMGGYQLIRRVQEKYQGRIIPVVVISHLSSAEDIIEAEVAGATAYMVKPIREQDLMDVLDRIATSILHGRRLQFFSKTIDRSQSSLV